MAVDDHRRGEVPVTAREVVIDIGAQLQQAVEGIRHLLAAECSRIEVNESLLIEVGALGQHDAVENSRFLPRLAAAGVNAVTIKTITVENPARLLTLRDRV